MLDGAEQVQSFMQGAAQSCSVGLMLQTSPCAHHLSNQDATGRELLALLAFTSFAAQRPTPRLIDEKFVVKKPKVSLPLISIGSFA